MRTYFLNYAGIDDDAEEFETEIKADEILLTVRVLEEGEEEPAIMEFRITALGIETIDV